MNGRNEIKTQVSLTPKLMASPIPTKTQLKTDSAMPSAPLIPSHQPLHYPLPQTHSTASLLGVCSLSTRNASPSCRRRLCLYCAKLLFSRTTLNPLILVKTFCSDNDNGAFLGLGHWFWGVAKTTLQLSSGENSWKFEQAGFLLIKVP